MVVINSLRFDRSVKRSWTCDLVEACETSIIFEGVFEKDVEHLELGLIRKGTRSREYYWLDRWYNVFEFHSPDGRLRNFYCNINMPPFYADGQLDYVDLEVDVVVWPDGRIEVLDLDEFEISAVAYAFPPTVRENVERALGELLGSISRREPPFDVVEEQTTGAI